MKARTFVLVASAILALALSGAVYAITNGQPDGNNHPYVGLLVFDDASGPAWRCSGALIGPNLVLTAGHCTDGAVAARVWFASDVTGNPDYPYGGPSAIEGKPYTYPGFCIGCGNGLPGFDTGDVGVVVLAKKVPKSTVSVYATLPKAGLVDTLAMKTAVDLVGYGVQVKEQIPGSPYDRWTGDLRRLAATSQLDAADFVQSDQFIKLSANPGQDKGGTCFGDSGGPNLLGGTTTILAVNSYVTNSNCTGVTYSNRIDRAELLNWVRSFSGKK